MFKFCDFLFYFFVFLGFFSKLLRLILKVNQVTTGHKKWPKMGQNSILSLGWSPLQQLEVGPRNGPYLLVRCKDGTTKYQKHYYWLLIAEKDKMYWPRFFSDMAMIIYKEVPLIYLLLLLAFDMAESLSMFVCMNVTSIGEV